jgi:non-ribosomal peptide synthetase component F
VKRFQELLPWVELHNLYGPTEAAIDVSHFACTLEGTERAVPIGRPIANTRLYIVDSASISLHVVATGVIA